MDPQDVAMAFHAAINAHDMARLQSLMAPGHTFTDASGAAWEGDDAVQAWRGFFEAFPDYSNRVDVCLRAGGDVVMAGSSACSEPALAGPALWRASVAGDAIASWDVREDTPEGRRARRLPPS